MHKKARLAALSLGGLLSVGLFGTVPTPESSVQAQAPMNVAASIERWQVLRQDANLPFESYANFILSHRGWPGEMDMRRRAERNIVPGSSGIADVTRFLRGAAAADGRRAHAATRWRWMASGQRDKQLRRARRAWAAGACRKAGEHGS
jgi:soluble lytic murein transglycosylase